MLLADVKSQLLSSACAALSWADTATAVPAADTVPAIILTVMATERRPAKNALFIFFLLINFIMKFGCGFYHSSAKIYSPPHFSIYMVVFSYFSVNVCSHEKRMEYFIIPLFLHSFPHS